jgi:hypothetical protein
LALFRKTAPTPRIGFVSQKAPIPRIGFVPQKALIPRIGFVSQNGAAPSDWLCSAKRRRSLTLALFRKPLHPAGVWSFFPLSCEIINTGYGTDLPLL